MALFLLQKWLLDAHIDSMLSAAIYLHCDALSRMVPHTEIVLTDFITHIIASPLLENTPIPHDYLERAPKSVQKLGSLILEYPSEIWVATVVFSPPSHLACLIIDCHTGTICWGDPAGQAAPSQYIQ